jgi:hypothetical protein
MAPAGQTNRLLDIAVAERAAGVGPVTMHDVLKAAGRRIESGARGRPVRRLRVYPTQTGAATECGPTGHSVTNLGHLRQNLASKLQSHILQWNRGSPGNGNISSDRCSTTLGRYTFLRNG